MNNTNMGEKNKQQTTTICITQTTQHHIKQHTTKAQQNAKTKNENTTTQPTQHKHGKHKQKHKEE